MPSFVEISKPVSEKIIEGFLQYMSLAAILVMLPGLFIYIGSPFLYLLHIKMALIGQAVSEKKVMEYYGNIIDFPFE